MYVYVCMFIYVYKCKKWNRSVLWVRSYFLRAQRFDSLRALLTPAPAFHPKVSGCIGRPNIDPTSIRKGIKRYKCTWDVCVCGVDLTCWIGDKEHRISMIVFVGKSFATSVFNLRSMNGKTCSFKCMYVYMRIYACIFVCSYLWCMYVCSIVYMYICIHYFCTYVYKVCMYACK